MTVRHVFITGASSGLGAGLALSYASPGRRLTLVGRNAERLEAIGSKARAKGAYVVIGQFDVGEAEPLGAWLRGEDADLPIDLLIACAGVSAGTHDRKNPEGQALASMQVRSNLLGTIHSVEPVLPSMIARHTGQIAVISSIAGLRGLPYSPAYSASKAGVRAYGEALRSYLRPHGVAVSVIVPGFFDTPMTDRFDGPKPFFMSLDRAVSIVRRGLDVRRSRITFPKLLAFGVRATDLMPAWLGDRIQHGFHFHIRPGS